MTIAENDESHLTGALAGLRVLDFSTTIAGAQWLQYRVRPAQHRQAEPGARPEIARRNGSDSPARRQCRYRPGEFSSGRDASVEARSRDAARAQSETDLLLDFRLRSDRPIGGTAGLCAGDPRGLRLRHGASGLSARPEPAGFLRHLPRRRADRGLRLRRHFVSAVSTDDHPAWPAYRRLDAGIDAKPDLERIAVVAIRGATDLAPDVRAD